MREAAALEELSVGSLSEMPAFASTFESHPKLAYERLARSLVAFLEAFHHLLIVEVGVAQSCCQCEGFDDVDASQLEVEECGERKKGANGRCLSSSREDLVKVKSWSLTEAAEYTERFASFE
eukprot:6190459-Pleurochrysis_carterae.AAC.1